MNDASAITAPQKQTSPPQRILVVEDDGEMRRLNADVLISHGYQVDMAENGDAAWGKLQIRSYDLVVTDNVMPKLTGVELLNLMRAARMNVPVIMATTALPREEFTRLPWLRPAATLTKPYTIDDLLGKVQDVLRLTDVREQLVAPPSGKAQPSAYGWEI